MKRIIPLVLILVIGAVLRLYMLSSNPPSLTWDEVSWGYNAYSLGIDGRDEFGRFLPLTYLESFGDYKPPLYAYVAAPFVKFLGLNELSVRLPSAILGILTILLTYLLTKKIFFSSDERKKEIIALLSSGILAISPWHILLSRAAFEANVATFFIILGIYLFFISLEKKWLMPAAGASLIVSMYTFNTARVFVPLFSAFLFLRYFKVLYRKKRALFVSASLGLIIFLPLFLFLLTPEAKLRFREVNIFTDPNVVLEANRAIANDGNQIWSVLLHNRRVGYALSYAKHYLDNLDPQFLFIRGDGNPKFSIQDVGQMYIWEIPFFVLGILFLFKKKEGHWLIIPVWILLGLIPAGTARETPHALRIETILPTFQILTAYGLFQLISNFQPKADRPLDDKLKPFVVGLTIAAVFNFSYFIHNYFTHYPKLFSSEWQYGYKEAINFIVENENNYDKFHITEGLGRPYIYFLFYTKYPPDKFREQAVIVKDPVGFTHIKGIGKYQFKEDVKDRVDYGERNVFIDEPGRLPGSIRILKEFKRLDGVTALVAYERKFTYEKKPK